MDFYLIAAGWLSLSTWIGILKVAIGLGMVIFVHELGHFAVAKMCGVKCEKFYLGFDFGGLRLCRFKCGETEYGIGIFPLGGYVKMLGQVDNPAQLREEIERAKQNASEQDTTKDDAAEPEKTESAARTNEGEKDPETDKNGSSDAGGESGSSGDKEIDLAAAEAALYDPRSYLAQSVPKRMAIISAGVVMNLIFAFFMATIAYKLGVKHVVCEVGQVVPGKTAWQLDLKVGDRITEIDGREMHSFRDLKESISLGNIENGLPIKVERPGVEGQFEKTTWPDSSGKMPVIGVVPPFDTTVAWKVPGSAAANAKPKLKDGDKIVSICQIEPGPDEELGTKDDVKIDEIAINDYPQLHAFLALHPDATLQLTVDRTAVATEEADGSTAEQPAAEADPGPIRVDPNPMRRLGLVMEMGWITAVQGYPPNDQDDARGPDDDSPAAKAGIKPGDKMLKIDGGPIGDPLTLPARLRKRAGNTITLTIQRGDEKKDIKVKLREAGWYEEPFSKNDPMSIPALGVAYRVLNRVESVIEGSPAAKAGLQQGDQIINVVIIPPDKEGLPEDLPYKPRKQIVPFSLKEFNWPCIIYALQSSVPGTKVELTWSRQGVEETETLAWYEDGDWLDPDRGLRFQLLLFAQKAESWGKAIQLGADETIHSTLLVCSVLSKIGRQFSATNLGGPIMIFALAKGAADQGMSELLIFLTIISANLAVLNFLPIPVLDGGHMVLLAYEGVRGKPADDRIVAAVTWLGLLFILSLMLWVIGLDIMRLWTGF